MNSEHNSHIRIKFDQNKSTLLKLLYFSFASRPPSKGEDEEDEKEEEEEEEATTREWCDLLLDMIEGR